MFFLLYDIEIVQLSCSIESIAIIEKQRLNASGVCSGVLVDIQ